MRDGCLCAIHPFIDQLIHQANVYWTFSIWARDPGEVQKFCLCMLIEYNELTVNMQIEIYNVRRKME